MYVYNPFGTAPEDFDRETAPSRIGRRIRAIRQEEDMSQGDLGEKVGLNANRIQQYENGARNPKFELCKQIAEALEVEYGEDVCIGVSSVKNRSGLSRGRSP